MTNNAQAIADVLVDTDWVDAHRGDTAVQLVESNGNASLYATGHIPGAQEFNWRTDQQNQLIRDFVTREEFAALMTSHGISNDTTVVFYGDGNNCFAAASYWLFKLYGHDDCRIMDGGRAKWQTEGRALSSQSRPPTPAVYRATDADLSIRAFRDQVLTHIYAGRQLLDVRSPEEFSGPVADLESYSSDSVQRAGHIPTAINIPWTAALKDDGTLKCPAQLRNMYRAEGISPDQPVIVYCHTGERSAHTWFVLSQLLEFPDVHIYDGSWSEWGNLVRAPIEWRM